MIMDYKEKAIQKLTDEHKNGKFDRYGQIVKNEVLKALTEFVRQDDEFAQAIVESSGTFSECIEKAMKGCGNGISDIEVYRRCVQFYFKGATVDFKMEINLVGEAAAPEETNSQTLGDKAEAPKQESKKISLSLLDFI